MRSRTVVRKREPMRAVAAINPDDAPGEHPTCSGPNHVWPGMTDVATLGKIDFQCGGGIEHRFDIALFIEIQIRAADGEPGVGDLLLVLEHVQGVH